MRVAIIEDEYFSYKELKRMLLAIDKNIRVNAHFKSIKDLQDNFNPNQFDVVFCDINLSDGKSIDVLGALHNEVPIIFTTAYDEFALNAFQYNSIDYLLKPFSTEELSNALSKFKMRISSSKINVEEIRKALNVEQKAIARTRFLVKHGNKYTYVATKTIAYFYVEDKVTFAKTFSNKSFIIEDSLNEIEISLDNSFFRVSRGVICSIESILSASKYFNSRLLLKLAPDYENEVLVSRVKVNEFLQWLDC